MKFSVRSDQRLVPTLCFLTKLFTGQPTMPGQKRRATPAARGGGQEPSAKQKKLPAVKQSRAEDLEQQKSEKRDLKFNNKRLRFISDTEKIKQGSKGVLYWMSRDQRVQGRHSDLFDLHF